ncbi:hypothetical protein J6590_007505 [Homalodisca vitripennis]|nr:hypothetical protein J6590_007505 [Homalodisca vitripennis]
MNERSSTDNKPPRFFVGPIESRIYSDFESVTDCCKGILQIYEDYLARLHNTEAKINYGAANALRFVNDVTDISCLVICRLNVYLSLPSKIVDLRFILCVSPNTLFTLIIIMDV